MGVLTQERLFEHASYRFAGWAHVRNVDGRLVVLDRTPFMPEIGGMEGDTGSIDGRPVLRTVWLEDQDLVAHEVEEADRFCSGRRVYCSVNYQRRYGLMRMATALDLTLLCLIRDEPSLGVQALEVFDRGASLELDPPVSVDLDALTKNVNHAVWQGLRVRVGPAGPAMKRLCKIEGFPELLGSGPRVAKTSEIGEVAFAAKPDTSAARRIECSLRGVPNRGI